MKQAIASVSLAVLGIALTATFPSHAQARRGLVVFNDGQDVFEAGPLPAPYDTHPDLVGFQAGYQCDVYGVFWIYFSISNCQPVAFNADTDEYVDAPEVVAAIQGVYQESDMKPGFWKGYMRYVVGLLVLLIVGFEINRKLQRTRSGADVAWQQDSRVQALLTELAKTERWTFERPEDDDTFRVVAARMMTGSEMLPIEETHEGQLVVYLKRKSAPAYSQASIDPATGELHRTEIGAYAFHTILRT